VDAHAVRVCGRLQRCHAQEVELRSTSSQLPDAAIASIALDHDATLMAPSYRLEMLQHRVKLNLDDSRRGHGRKLLELARAEIANANGCGNAQWNLRSARAADVGFGAVLHSPRTRPAACRSFIARHVSRRP
jgi:hypothetical protein